MVNDITSGDKKYFFIFDLIVHNLCVEAVKGSARQILPRYETFPICPCIHYLLFLFTSCVAKKKFVEATNAISALQKDSLRLENDLASVRNNLRDTKQAVEDLQKKYDDLSSAKSLREQELSSAQQQLNNTQQQLNSYTTKAQQFGTYGGRATEKAGSFTETDRPTEERG